MTTPPDQQPQNTSDDDHGQVNTARRMYHQHSLNKFAQYHFSPKPLLELYMTAMRRSGYGDGIRNAVPIVKWLPNYKVKEFLLHDFVAGTTAAIMTVPQGMAGALLAHAPPIMGIYMSFFPIIIYVIFGLSPHIALGTFAVSCLMAGEAVQEFAMDVDGKPALYTPLEVLSLLSFIAGAIQLIMWLLRLGALSSILSEPVVSGFTTGAAFHVIASQLKELFGVKLPRLPENYRVITTVVAMVNGIGQTNWTTFIISFISCILLALNNDFLKPWVSKRSRLPVPAELILILSATILSKFFMFEKKYNVALVGSIPTGLPMPKVPRFSLFESVLLYAILQTIVTYTVTLSMALTFAAKEKYEIDANQELLAMGSSNIFASFFSCAPVCASLSRSYVQYMAGCKTLITAFITTMWILVVLLWIGPLFEQLPRCVLAAIMVVSLKGLLLQVKDLIKFWKLCYLDATVWLVSFFVTAVVSIEAGLAAGMLTNLGALFFRSQVPYTCLLGRVMDTDIYLDIKRYRAAQEIPGIKIFHYCGGLNFASKNLFRAALFRKIGYMHPAEHHDRHSTLTMTASPYEWDPDLSKRVKCVVVSSSALSYVDAPGIKALVAAKKELASSDIIMLIAGANAPVLEMVERYNALEQDSLQTPTFPTVHDAVMYYQMLQTNQNSNTDTTNS